MPKNLLPIASSLHAKILAKVRDELPADLIGAIATDCWLSPKQVRRELEFFSPLHCLVLISVVNNVGNTGLHVTIRGYGGNTVKIPVKPLIDLRARAAYIQEMSDVRAERRKSDIQNNFRRWHELNKIFGKPTRQLQQLISTFKL